MTTLKNTISSTTPWYNPFFSPNGKQIEQICFYDKTGVIFTTTSPWFGDNNPHKFVVFPEDIQNRRKVDYSRNEFFTAPHPQTWSKGDVNTLFIPAEKVGFECLGEYKAWENDTSRNYRTKYRLKLSVILKKGQDKNEGLTDHTIEIEGLYRQEKKEFGVLCDQISKKAEEQNVKLSSYDVERLLKVLDISIKP